MENFILTVLIIAVVLAVTTYIMHRKFRDKKQLKYMPAIGALTLAVYNIIKGSKGGGMEGLANVVVGMLLFAAFLSGIITGLVLDFLVPRWKKGKSKRN